VGDRTFIDIQIATLARAGVQSVVLSLGYLAEQVIAAVAATKSSIPVQTVVEPKLLGTGGAVAYVLDTLDLDEVLVANGDTYLDGDLSPMNAALDRQGGEMFRMAVVEVPDRARFGGVECSADGRVVGFLEKGRSGGGAINAGLYRLCRAALPAPGRGPYSLEGEVLPQLVQQRRVTARPIAGQFIDIGVPADYQRFCLMQGGAA
jgi:NDP-sugar pyrophosphorylase family protein